MPNTDKRTTGGTAVLDDMPEPLFSVGDTPRARLGDELTSHRAADRSQRSLPRVRRAVLRIVATMGPINGNDLNEEFRASRDVYGRAHFDSPRKRAGELARDGLLYVDRSSQVEGVYTLTAAGRMLLDDEVTR